MGAKEISHFSRWIDYADKLEELLELGENLLEDRTQFYADIQNSDIAGNEYIEPRDCNDLTNLAYFADRLQQFISGTLDPGGIVDSTTVIARMRKPA